MRFWSPKSCFYIEKLFNSIRWPIYIFNLVDITKLPKVEVCIFSQEYLACFVGGAPWRGGLMVSALVPGASGLGSIPGRGSCVVFT